MKVADFVKNYYLHDSSLIEIIVGKEEKNVRLIVDLCSWMQDDYVEGEPEIKPIEILFSGVTYTENLERTIDAEIGDEFIASGINDKGEFHADLETSEAQEPYEIVIHAEDVRIFTRDDSSDT